MQHKPSFKESSRVKLHKLSATHHLAKHLTDPPRPVVVEAAVATEGFQLEPPNFFVVRALRTVVLTLSFSSTFQKMTSRTHHVTNITVNHATCSLIM